MRNVTSCYINVTSYAACGKARHINVTSHCAVCNDISHHQPMSKVLNVTNQCPVEKFKAPAVASKPASADTWSLRIQFQNQIGFYFAPQQEALPHQAGSAKPDYQQLPVTAVCFSRLSAFHICLIFTFVCFSHLNFPYPSMWAVLKNHSPKLKVDQLEIIQACLCFKQFCCNQFKTTGVI